MTDVFTEKPVVRRQDLRLGTVPDFTVKSFKPFASVGESSDLSV